MTRMLRDAAFAFEKLSAVGRCGPFTELRFERVHICRAGNYAGRTRRPAVGRYLAFNAVRIDLADSFD